MKAHVHYKGTFDDGTVFDSSEGREPLVFELGKNQVIPGFEKAVASMKEGEKKKITIEADEAYGQPREELIQTVPKEMLGELASTVKEGIVLGVNHPASPQPIPAKVVKVDDNSVTLDMNHPLAVKKLHFELELVKLEE